MTAGGGLAAVLSMIVFPQFTVFASERRFLGALLAALVVYMLSFDQGVSPLKLILAGVAVNALLGAVMNGFMVLYSERVQAVLPFSIRRIKWTELASSNLRVALCARWVVPLFFCHQAGKSSFAWR